jgi:uncharacterized repeat protein (TIGR01451 family)
MAQLRRLGVTVGRLARSRIARFGLATWILGLAALAAAPASLALNPVTLSTPYPAIEVAPGAKVSLAISVDTEDAGRVDLTVEDVPDGWLATLRGGGFLVNGVHATGSEATEVTLDVTVPEGAESGVQQLTLRADSDGSVATLPIDIRVTPNAAGEVALTTDFPELRGAADTSFSFNLTLSNDTPDELTFGVVATAPAGWTANATVTSQAQAASAIVDAGGTTSIKVDVEAPEGVEAGVYPITVEATSGSRTATTELSVEVTGSYELELTTPDGRLSANASAGSVTDLTLVVRNSGTAPVEGVTFSGAAPTGWEVTFEPDTPITVPADEQGVQVIAHLTPSGNAIAGDYVTTFRASSEQANASAEFRVTIETSLLWGAVGLALIALVVAGLWWTFRRYGRR